MVPGGAPHPSQGVLGTATGTVAAAGHRPKSSVDATASIWKAPAQSKVRRIPTDSALLGRTPSPEHLGSVPLCDCQS